MQASQESCESRTTRIDGCYRLMLYIEFHSFLAIDVMFLKDEFLTQK